MKPEAILMFILKVFALIVIVAIGIHNVCKSDEVEA